MTITRLLLIPAILLLFLTACQSSPGTYTRPETTIQTIPAEQSGNFAEAAEQYLALASDASTAEQAVYYLRAATLFYQLQQLDKSRTALSKVDQKLLSLAQKTEATQLAAQLAIAEQDGDKALAAIAEIDLSALSGDDRLALLKLQAEAYGLNENWLEQSNTYLNIDQLLSDSAALEQNRQALWQSLMQLSPQALDLFNPGIPPEQNSGWFALAYAVKAYQDNPEALDVALENWKRSYPNHPADPALYQQTLSAGISLPENIGDIAVLLPVTGQFVEAAKAIKEGIIAAHYASGANTQLHFIDIRTDPVTGQSNVIEAYNDAVNRGASIVIGPLEKQSVDVLATASDLPVPVLALNRIDARLSRPNLFQYGLAPEDDAMAIAEYGEKHQFKRAVILSPQNEWGDRLAKAFSDEWQANGGTVLYRSSYPEAENDFRNTLIPFLGLDESERRYDALRGTLSRSLSYEPRRRQDIDFIFLVARPLKARQLVPQLRFHRSGQLPILSSSHAYSGQPDPQQNIDLNGLIIADVSWMFAGLSETDPAYQALKDRDPRNFGSLLRLYAMGADAYRLVPELGRLSRDVTASYQGATGNLSINAQGQVERHMHWGQFEQGELQLIE